MLFDTLHSPVWVFDIARQRMWWANAAAVTLWGADTLDQLLARDFAADMSDVTLVRLNSYQEQFARHNTVTEQWTFYPGGQPVTVNCTCSGIPIDDGRLAMLVEGQPLSAQTSDRDARRGVEALRYTSVMVSLFDLSGQALFHNPAATCAFGTPGAGGLPFTERFQSPHEADPLWAQLLAGQSVHGEYCCLTRQGEQWHALQGRLTDDPVTGNRVVLVEQQDVTEKHAAQERYRQIFLGNKAPMLLIDPADGAIVEANQAAVAFYGYPLATLRTLRISAINTLSPQAIKAEMEQARQENRSQFFFQHRLACGEVRDVEVHSGPVSIGDRQLLYSIIHDITERRAAEQALQQSEYKYRSLVDSTPAGFWLVDAAQRTVQVNPALCRLLGYSAGEMQGRHLLAFVDADNAAVFRNQIDKIPAHTHRHYEVSLRHKDGYNIPVQFHATTQHDASGQVTGSFAFIFDLTAMKRLSATLEKLSSAVEHTSSSVIITDAHGSIEYVNPHFVRLTGYTLADVQGQTPGFLEAGDGQAAIYNTLWDTIRAGRNWSGELHNRKKNGELYWTLLTISPIQNAAGVITHYVGVGEDVTALKEAHARAERLALFDSLTDLANRRLFLDRLGQAVRDSGRTGRSMALLYLDLDRFKDVNDTLGHDVGDQLLIAVAQRLRRCVRERDTVARLGGDEFSILLPDVDGTAGVRRVAQAILTALALPYDLPGLHGPITSSIGISLAPNDSTVVEELLRNADMAMYSAKAAGKNTYRFFTETMNQEVRQRLTIERELHQALQAGQLLLHYQPVVELASGRIVGAEALLRWDRPDRGLTYPATFIAIAEESDLILALGQWVLHTACRELRDLLTSGSGLAWVSVNIAARQFLTPHFCEQVSAVLAENRLQPGMLTLELTESVLLEQTERAISVLHRLKARGLRLAIDDFGTGYSSLSYLTRFPVDTLKIDRSFVQGLLQDSGSREIVAAIIAMAGKLELGVVAEGIETEAQQDFLCRNDCRLGQGYRYGRPMPLEHLRLQLLTAAQTLAPQHGNAALLSLL